ncbi:protein gamete expressed 1 [Tanacetum coccineum]
MTIIILHMLTSTRQTYSIRSRLYLELGVKLLIKIVVLIYGNDVEQQQWIIDNIRLLFIILASCQLMNAIYKYRDYDSLNHQMLQTLVDKVNKLRNKNDDDGYNDDVDWSSWIDSDITEDELDDLEYVPPKGVPETSFITTSSRNYNLRSRH